MITPNLMYQKLKLDAKGLTVPMTFHSVEQINNPTILGLLVGAKPALETNSPATNGLEMSRLASSREKPRWEVLDGELTKE